MENLEKGERKIYCWGKEIKDQYWMLQGEPGDIM